MIIDNINIGEHYPVFVIAELSANHNQDIEIAISSIKAAKKAGANAIKLQTYTPDTLTIDCNNEYFQINQGTLWDGQTLYSLYEKAYTPWDWHKQLFQVASEEGIVCFSTPFDKSAVDFLEDLNVPAYKLASFEIQDIPLLKYIAKRNKPIIISTGIATFEDIQLAINTCVNEGNDQLILLKCTSSYPAPLELANLRTMLDIKEKFAVEIGLSDHTMGDIAPITATALGAKVIEKHFIIDRNLGGPDVDFSLNPIEFRAMVDSIRDTEKALGSVSYELPEKVLKNRKFARSLFVVNDIRAGEKLTNENIRSIRPGYGLHPKYLDEVLKSRATIDLVRGTPLKKEHYA